jgi:hypothetical protein
MNTDLKHGLLTEKIIGIFYDVYNELGHGFLESVYQKSLVIGLNAAGLSVCSRVEIRFRSVALASAVLKRMCWSRTACYWSSKLRVILIVRIARNYSTI